LSCCADVRIAASDTKFSVKEVDIGLAADIGTLSRLPKVVGSFSWVKDVCLTARVFSADEALRAGYVSQIQPSKTLAIAEAVKMATIMAGKSPVAIQGTKELLNYSRDHTVQEGLRYTAVWNSAALQTSDILLSIQAGMQKRKATFEKL
jgi:delta(3,5)-delta(2,4)-dienoyl-CoA isomerase